MSDGIEASRSWEAGVTSVPPFLLLILWELKAMPSVRLDLQRDCDTRLQWAGFAVSILPNTNSGEDAMTGNVSKNIDPKMSVLNTDSQPRQYLCALRHGKVARRRR